MMRFPRHALTSLFIILAAVTLVACGSGSSSGNPLASPANDAPGDLSALDFSDLSEVEIAECDSLFPCQWQSSGGGLSVSVVSLHVNQSTEQLEAIYLIQTTRDTTLQIPGGSSAIDSTSRRYTSRSIEIAGSSRNFQEGDRFEAFAGIDLFVEQTFAETVGFSTEAIARLTIDLVEVDTQYRIGFTDLPLRVQGTDSVDCRQRLPCTWNSPDADYSVTLVLADPWREGRLTIDFVVATERNREFAFEPETVAQGNDGTRFKPKLQTLDGVTDFLVIETELPAGARMDASQSFFRAGDHAATYLSRLDLNLYEISTPGVDKPVFTNVPFN